MTKPYVLIIEDEVDVGEQLEHWLQSKGFEAKHVVNHLQAAMRLKDRTKPEVNMILSDFDTGRMNAEMFLKRNLHCGLPVIGISDSKPFNRKIEEITGADEGMGSVQKNEIRNMFWVFGLREMGSLTPGLKDEAGRADAAETKLMAMIRLALEPQKGRG